MTDIATVVVDRVKARELPLIWRRRFPVGAVSVVAGVPGISKSTLGVLIAGELSQQGLVSVVSNTEDDVHSVVRPRFDVLKRARLGLIHLVAPDEAFMLPRDLSAVESMIVEVGASVLILDPVGAHFWPERRLHDRRVLRSLTLMARQTGCAIVGIHHTTKGGGAAVQRIGGSMGGLVGVARAVYMFGYDPRDSDRLALACVKLNGAERPPSLLFERDVGETDEGFEAPLLHVIGHTFKADAERLHAYEGHHDPETTAAAAEWLTLFLLAGEDCKRLRGEVRAEGQMAGHSWSTLNRLAVELDFDQLESHSVRWWRLPNDHPARNQRNALLELQEHLRTLDQTALGWSDEEYQYQLNKRFGFEATVEDVQRARALNAQEA